MFRGKPEDILTVLRPRGCGQQRFRGKRGVGIFFFELHDKEPEQQEHGSERFVEQFNGREQWEQRRGRWQSPWREGGERRAPIVGRLGGLPGGVVR